MAEVKQWMGGKPEQCDICHEPLTGDFIDGKTSFGPWGIMCTGCHIFNGCGLGPGRGQKYDGKTLVKVAG